MKKASFRTYISLALVLGTLLTLGVLMSCSGGGSSSSQPPAPSTTGTVTTNLTDPPPCAFPNGNFTNVWFTVTRVRAHISSSAGPNDSGWVDLLDLRTNPKQIDLFSTASTTCILTQLGSTTGLPPGNYQQIRLFLLSNMPSSGEATPSSNACGSSNGWNCVVFKNPDGTTQTAMLDLSGEDQTGIKIPPGQIAGGAIILTAGQSADLNITFDTCASIVQEGNGMYRLNPTLHAGEVALNNNSISGAVVDPANSNAPIAGALVLVEQPDPTDATTDIVMESTTTDANGNFIFCPLSNNGTYDVVVAAKTTSALGVTTTYNATIAFHVPVGTALTTIPLTAEPGGTLGTASQPATISGQMTSTGAVATVTLSALQDATPMGSASPMHVTVPLFGASSAVVGSSGAPTPLPAGPMPSVMTASPAMGSTCAGGAADCVTYNLTLSASNPEVGTFSSGSISYTPPNMAAPVSYSVRGVAANCPPPPSTPGIQTAGSIIVTPGNTTTVGVALAFTGCS